MEVKVKERQLNSGAVLIQNITIKNNNYIVMSTEAQKALIVSEINQVLSSKLLNNEIDKGEISNKLNQLLSSRLKDESDKDAIINEVNLIISSKISVESEAKRKEIKDRSQVRTIVHVADGENENGTFIKEINISNVLGREPIIKLNANLKPKFIKNIVTLATEILQKYNMQEDTEILFSYYQHRN